MIYSFFKSPETFWKAWGGLAILLAAIFIQVEISVLLNDWYGSFYDILQNAQKHSIDEFWEEMITFSKLAGVFVILATLSSYFGRVYAFWWRESITFNSIEIFRNSSKFVEGASQRIQEDSYLFSKLVEGLFLSFIRAVMTLIAFIPVLWTLSEKAAIPFLEDIEGSLVYVALGVSIVGFAISLIISYKLPRIETSNQKHEASFRRTLVLSEPIGPARTNYTQPEDIDSIFGGLKKNYKRMFNHYAALDTWLNLFDQVMVIVPYLIMAPALFTGAITLGTLVMVSNSFSKVRDSFSFLINNFEQIIKLRSVHFRLKEFTRTLKD